MAGRTGLTESEREAIKAKKLEKLQEGEARSRSGTTFKYNCPHDYPSARAFQRKINSYFLLREADKEPQTIPGLALFLGFRTDVLVGYDPGSKYDAYRRLVEYALQRIEAYTATHFFKAKGPTKGVEFLMQNTAGWANKSDVKSKATMELTEKKKLENATDEELREKARTYLPALQLIIGGKDKTG